MSGLFLAQSSTEDTSSAAAIVFGMLALVGIVSVVALTGRGRRSLMPAVAILLGTTIIYTSVADALSIHSITVLTILGLLIGVTLVLGGFGALREGIALPPVEGHEPEIEPQSPRITPPEADSAKPGAHAPEVR